VAIVTFPGGDQARLKRIEVVHLQEFLALLIVVLQGARLLQQMVPLSEPASQDDLTSVANKLNHLFGGLSRSQMEEQEAELTPLESRVKRNTLLMMQEVEEEAFNPYVEGLRHLLGQPEFSRGERASAPVDVVEDRVLMREILVRAVAQRQVQVVIGHENEKEALWPFSLVLCPYGLPDGAMGVLGVLGPTRLSYQAAIGGVRFLSGLMSEMMASVYGATS
jgi:heat-inducible transcriptional repressor